MAVKQQADIGVFGGSGFYNLLDNVEEVWIDTPYGPPSDKVALAHVGEQRVAFLPRHGKDHIYPPHKINYRANLWAMKELGVTRIFGPCAAGSLQPDIKPGDFVIMDQFVNRTYGRKDTFFEGPFISHVSPADPYCPELRELACETGKELGITIHENGTIVVINGPRYSTRAESKEFQQNGWHSIGMTQYPEAMLARELEICYAGIALITDFDSGLEGHPEVGAVTHDQVLEVFNANIEKLKKLLFTMVDRVTLERKCPCKDAVGKH